MLTELLSIYFVFSLIAFVFLISDKKALEKKLKQINDKNNSGGRV